VRALSLEGDPQARPVASVCRPSVRVEGFVPPPSRRAITAWVVFIRCATCSWVKAAGD